MKDYSDIQVWNLISDESTREKNSINLIASENIASEEIRAAVGSILMNKYAEGYPGRRYYSGCQFVDEIEELAIERAKKLFGAEYANVQVHAGSQANMAVYFAILKPGDTVLGMQLSSDGHLTHGHPINFSGALYNFVSYSVNKETEMIDYDEVEKIALEHKPKLIIAGASAYSRTIDFEKFSQIAKKIGAYLMTDIAHIAGLIATDLHPSPVPYADFVTSTTHKTMRGPRGAFILCKKNIYVNRNTIPFDPQKPFITSGIRIGTPFITSQGKNEKDSRKIAHKVNVILSNT